MPYLVNLDILKQEMQTKIGSAIYLGVKRDVYYDPQQSRDFKFSRGDFVVSKKLSQDWALFNIHFEEFCKQQIKSYIDRGIAKLKHKRITVPVKYTDGLVRPLETTIVDYLQLTGYSRDLDYEIGSYEREWGINAVNPTTKKFTLFFNLRLIKFDDGPHIEHVVAHELAHIFHRDHGPLFQETLQQLDPNTRWSQNFFDSRIRFVGQSNTTFYILLIGLGLILILYFGYSALQFISDILFTSSPNF